MQIMKNKAGKNCGNTISTLNTLRLLDQEFISNYNDYKRILQLKFILQVQEKCIETLIKLKTKEV